MTLYERLKQGETINVRAKGTGTAFTIQIEQWGGATGYTVLTPDLFGELHIVPGYKGLLLDPETVRDWLSQLEEEKA